MEENDLKTILKEADSHEYVNLRSSLRVSDSFPVQFYLQTAKNVLEKRKTYKLKPTRERQKRFLLEKGIIPPQIFSKINAMDSDVFDVFADIYRRIAVMSGRDIDTDWDEEEEIKEDVKADNIGTCIDLSGSGLKFLCGSKFKPKDILKVIISPTAAVPRFSVSTLIEVIKVVLVKDASPAQRYAIVAKYHAANEDDLEMITRYTVLRHIEQNRLRKRNA